MTTPYERIFVTVRYACGHYAARAVFRTPETENDSRTIDDSRRCDMCEELAEQAKERRVESQVGYYTVDGRKMLVSCDKDGYWRGRCYEQGKSFRKYFGIVDPRPSLEEVLDA